MESLKNKISSIVLNGNRAAKKTLSWLVDCITKIIWMILWMPAAIIYARGDTYYPEEQRKSVIQRILENAVWVLRYHRANAFYNLYGLDIKGKKSKEYIDENSFWHCLDLLNYDKGHASQICILRDKYLFYKYMNSNSVPTPEVFGVIKDGECYTNKMEKCEFDVLRDKKDYFVKTADGECASFIKHISSYQEFKKLDIFGKGMYILQDTVYQSDDISKLNHGSINTLRIVTTNISGEIRVLSSLLRIGTNGSGYVDNWAAGGVAVGIEKDGKLKKYGFYKPGYGTKISKHPDSGIRFETFIVPELDEAYKIAVKAHRLFYNVGAIGWDIAITDNGPIIIEGNDNFEITLMQACDRPLRREIEALLKTK